MKGEHSESVDCVLKRQFNGLQHSCVGTRTRVKVFGGVWGWEKAKLCMGSALTQTAPGSL